MIDQRITCSCCKYSVSQANGELLVACARTHTHAHTHTHPSSPSPSPSPSPSSSSSPTSSTTSDVTLEDSKLTSIDQPPASNHVAPTPTTPYANMPQSQEFRLVVCDERFALLHIASDRWLSVANKGTMAFSTIFPNQDAINREEHKSCLFQVCIKVALKLAATNKYLKASVGSSGSIQVCYSSVL